MSFLIRVLFAVFWLVVFAAVLYAIVVLIGRGIRFLLPNLWEEFAQFFGWVRSLLPVRKRRKKKMRSPPTSTDK